MAWCLARAVLLLCLSLNAVSRRIDTSKMSRGKAKIEAAKKAEKAKIEAAEKTATVNDKANSSSAWRFDHLQLGPRGGPLLPALVPAPGQVYEVMNREAVDFMESNEYHWNLVSVKDKGRVAYPGRWFAQIDGGFFSNKFGWKTTVVRSNSGRKLFVIRMTKHIFNPLRWSWSFRITHPRTGEVLYTINKDWVGTGVMWLRDEWRVYRGHKRDGDEVYYCVSSYLGYKYDFYHSKKDYLRNRPAVASVSQSIARSVLGAPDAFTLKVEEGEDTALLLATSVIHDMVYEHEEEDERIHRNHERNHRQRRARQRYHRRHRANSFIEQDAESAEMPRDLAHDPEQLSPDSYLDVEQQQSA